MIVWIDAQFSPAIATWLTNTFSVDAVAIRDLTLRQAKDKEIFEAARLNNAAVMTKDSDFVLLLDQFRTTSSVYLGHVRKYSNARLKEILTVVFPKAVQLLQSGESLVEIQ